MLAGSYVEVRILFSNFLVKEFVMRQMRQGDLLFEECKAVPASAKKSESGVLAYGEATGHCHRVDLSECNVYVDVDGSMTVEPKTDCEVVHDEHGSIPLAKGMCYKVTRQFEYDSIAESKRRQVAD